MDKFRIHVTIQEAMGLIEIIEATVRDAREPSRSIMRRYWHNVVDQLNAPALKLAGQRKGLGMRIGPVPVDSVPADPLPMIDDEEIAKEVEPSRLDEPEKEPAPVEEIFYRSPLSKLRSHCQRHPESTWLGKRLHRKLRSLESGARPHQRCGWPTQIDQKERGEDIIRFLVGRSITSPMAREERVMQLDMAQGCLVGTYKGAGQTTGAICGLVADLREILDRDGEEAYEAAIRKALVGVWL